jgi:hypothetical protein
MLFPFLWTIYGFLLACRNNVSSLARKNFSYLALFSFDLEQGGKTRLLRNPVSYDCT